MSYKVNAIKKLLSLILVLCFILPSAIALADDDVFIEIENAKVKINTLQVDLIFENADNYPVFFMYILRPGVSFDNLTPKEDLFEDVLYFDEILSKDKEKYTFTYNIDDSNESGYYTVVVVGAQVKSREFFFANEEYRREMFDVFRSSESTADDIIDIIESNKDIAEASGIKVPIFDMLSRKSKEFFAEYVLKVNDRSDFTEEQVAEMVNFALVYATIAKEGNADKSLKAIDEAIVMFNLNEDVSQFYTNMTDKARIKVASHLMSKGFTASNDFDKAKRDFKETLEDSIIVGGFNQTHWQAIFDYLKEFKNYFPLDKMNGVYEFFYKDNSELTKDQIKKKESAAKDIQNGKDYYSTEEITDSTMKAKNKALQSSVPDDSGKKDSTKGGGGGGSSSSGLTSYTLPQDMTQLKVYRSSDYYTDVTAVFSWADESIAKLTAKGVVEGIGDRKFNPQGAVTREEFIKMLVNALQISDLTATTSFTDVPQDSWYYIYVASAEKAGITQGMGDGSFGVGRTITRQDMITMVYRAVIKLGRGVNRGSQIQISDYASISDYAKEAVNYMNGAIPPIYSPMLAPTATATRAEAAYVIAQLLD